MDMSMKTLLLVSSCLLSFPESYAACQNISPPFEHYTLACEIESAKTAGAVDRLSDLGRRRDD